ncbi:MAG: LysM peptidoglycan-binding domain-containing protein [Candidatus Methylomirabilales bacterium]
MDRNHRLIWLIFICSGLMLAGCAHPVRPRSSSQSSPLASLEPIPEHRPRYGSALAIAAPWPPLPSSPRALPHDPLLTRVQELLWHAQYRAEQGHHEEAMSLLVRAHALLATDEAALTAEARRHREETREVVEALSEELATIQEMTVAPSEEEVSLVRPEEAEAWEKAIPEIPTPPEPEITYDVPLEMNAKVLAYIDHFTTDKRDLTAAALERSGRYLPMMRQIFAEKGLPQDLVNLAYIESAFKLYAYSRARAVGMWQFIRGTGRKYGLRRTWWVDERRDPVKATAAAADYLSDLYDIFQSWPLAIAAYNSGEGKVSRAIRRQKTTNFWKLKLPRETRYFVPAFMAMTVIAKDPERYGFERPLEQSWELDRVALREPTDLRLLSKAAGITTKQLKDLNPELRRLVTPPEQDYLLNIPSGTKDSFLLALAELPQARRTVWRRHRVRRGESLSTISQRYRTTVAVLMEMNRLRNPHRIRAGTLISVPVPALTLAKSSGTRRPHNGRMPSQYVVQPGDTLWEIARDYRVSTQDLKRWNNLNSSLIYPGRTLQIHPHSSDMGQTVWRQHRVRRGETLSTIARRYRTTVALLMEMNRLNNPHQIRAGTRISVPVPDNSSGFRASQ